MKLPVPFGDQYCTKASVKFLAQEILAPISAGIVNPQSTLNVRDFVGKSYLPQYVDAKLRPSARKTYRDTWEDHIKHRVGKMTLRCFGLE